MAYKLHKPAEQVEPFIEAVHAFNALAKVPQLDGPIGWRDRITEIDVTTKSLTTERAELVQKLASEGFALIGRINDLLTEAAQKHEDMSDWRNWKAGDLLRMENEDEWCGVSNGRLYKLESDIAYEFMFIDDGEEERRFKPSEIEHAAKDFSWHSRPSA